MFWLKKYFSDMDAGDWVYLASRAVGILALILLVLLMIAGQLFDF